MRCASLSSKRYFKFSLFIWGDTGMPKHMFWSQRTPNRSGFLPSTMWGFRDRIQTIRLGAKCLCLISHPTGPHERDVLKSRLRTRITEMKNEVLLEILCRLALELSTQDSESESLSINTIFQWLLPASRGVKKNLLPFHPSLKSVLSSWRSMGV